MRIASVEAVPYSLPFREPYVTAAGTLTRREMVLLRLRDEDGLIGLGEAVTLSMRGGASLGQVVEEMEGLGEWDTLDETTLHGSAATLSAPARCAGLTALLDLRGKRASAGESAAGGVSPSVRCNATLAAGDPGAVVSAAERWARDGFSTFKLKLGTGDAAAQVRAVREALGPRARIRVDANAAWDLDTARRILGEIEPSKVGGPEEALEIAEVLSAYMSSALDGPVGIAAALQVAQSLGDLGRVAGESLAHGLATQRLFASTIASVECELRGDMLHPPAGPGLGVEIDEGALATHRLDTR